jgi:hypothetical protein
MLAENLEQNQNQYLEKILVASLEIQSDFALKPMYMLYT